MCVSALVLAIRVVLVMLICVYVIVLCCVVLFLSLYGFTCALCRCLCLSASFLDVFVYVKLGCDVLMRWSCIPIFLFFVICLGCLFSVLLCYVFVHALVISICTVFVRCALGLLWFICVCA